MKKYVGVLAITLILAGCSSENSEEAPIEQESSTIFSSASTEESSVSESTNQEKGAYNLESGQETAEFFRDYFGSEMELQPYEFEEEQEMNYMYPDIFTVSADAESDRVQQITFFDVDEEDIRTILDIASFPEDPVIEEALSYEGELKEPSFGDNYATEYKDDLGLGVSITIKGNMWSGTNEKPYSLALLFDEESFEE